MISEEEYLAIALSFPNTEQKPHFDRIGVKVIGKRMFTTYWPENNTANIFLSLKAQASFCKKDRSNIYPVPNKWGEKGATTFELDLVSEKLIREALLLAYNDVLLNKKR